MKIHFLGAGIVALTILTQSLCKASDVINSQTLGKATCIYVENEKTFPAIYSKIEDGKWRRAKYAIDADSSIPETDYRVLKKDESSVYLVSDDSFWGGWDQVAKLDLDNNKCWYFENVEHKSEVNLDDPSLVRWEVKLVNPSL